MNKILKVTFISIVFALLISGAAAAAQNNLTISNLVILEDRNINENSSGNVTVVLGSANIQSDVNGSVIVVFGKATINGNVSGDVVSAFGEVYLERDSLVNGNLVSVGKFKEAEGADIEGSRMAFNVDFISLFKSNNIIINALIISSLIILVAGLLLITIFTARFRAMSYSIGSAIPRRMILGGLVIISLTIVLAFLIFLIVAPVLYVIFIMLADIIASIYLGTLIFRNNYERTAIYIEFFVGHIIISILKIVPLIFIPSGSYTSLLVYGICFILAEFILSSFGIGTVIDTGFGKKQHFPKHFTKP